MATISGHINTLTKLARIIDASQTCRRRHCYKVEQHALFVCRKLDLPNKEVKIIKVASILHDIGKIGIDLTIIKKPAKLTVDEWASVRMHPVIGANIIRQLGFLDEIVPSVMHHHARFDGKGYPDPDMSGEAIPLGARIIAVVDAFDAMTNDRPYRKAMPREAALDELEKCAGQQFDPDIVKVFLNLKL
jgi:putative nucleotidyltransferase with HDIG domain